MKLKKIALAAGAIVFAFGASMSASAEDFAKAEEAVKYRQSAFTIMEKHFANLGAMAMGKAPFDAELAAKNAQILAVAATLPWGGFGDGTEGGKSKPAIWKEGAKFEEKREAFAGEAAKLLEAANSGDLEKLKAAFNPAFESCKSCHKEFKNK